MFVWSGADGDAARRRRGGDRCGRHHAARCERRRWRRCGCWRVLWQRRLLGALGGAVSVRARARVCRRAFDLMQPARSVHWRRRAAELDRLSRRGRVRVGRRLCVRPRVPVEDDAAGLPRRELHVGRPGDELRGHLAVQRPARRWWLGGDLRGVLERDWLRVPVTRRQLRSSAWSPGYSNTSSWPLRCEVTRSRRMPAATRRCLSFARVTSRRCRSGSTSGSVGQS